jgi:hypothetical protein
MANTTNIPPQAYTRDTLVKAIEWISHQPVAVRERANSADLIVSFYLQARRRMTAAQLEAPVSGENFKQDLKHLAQGLKQFEEPSAPPTPAMPNRSRSETTANFDLPEAVQAPIQAPQTAPPPPHKEAAQVQKGTPWSVDAKSLAYAREVQERFNLSNETEALRMLVTLGIERARDLFP